MKKILSIVAGVLSALGLAYIGFAQIWALPYANEINQSIAVVVQLLSALLAVFTGQKLYFENVEKKEVAEDVRGC